MKKKADLFSLVALLAALSLTAPGQEKTEAVDRALDRTAPAQVEKADVPGIRNFSRVRGPAGFGGAMTGFGGATEPSAMAGLKKDGFKSVINLRLASEPGADVVGSRAAAEAAGLTYIHLPFDAENPDPRLVEGFFAAVGNTANHPVYIYCHSANRVGALWLITRVLKDGWAIDRAREEAVAIGLNAPAAEAFAVEYITAHPSAR